MVRVFVIREDSQRRAVCEFATNHWKQAAEAGKPLFVKFTDDATRNLEQNAAMWPILEAFSEQLTWPVNGQMVRMSAEEWKDVLTAAYRQENARLAMGLNGGVVMLGLRTREFGKKEFSEWLDFLNATAIERGVNLK